ncbi:hypothetical protein Lser_V15G30194 [Lactuca serriola]
MSELGVRVWSDLGKRWFALMTKNFSELGLRKEDCVEGSWIDSVLYWANFDNTTEDNYCEGQYIKENALIESSKVDRCWQLGMSYSLIPIDRK